MRGQESFPLGVPTPQEEQAARIEAVAKKLETNEKEIHEAEDRILEFKKEIARSQGFIDEWQEMLATVEHPAKRQSLTERIGREVRMIQTFTEQVESASAALAALLDKKKALTDEQFDTRSDMRHKLH
jgi:predicted  nucleic acid-binding Zn-ribbon protein